MILGFEIESHRTNTEQNHHKNDEIVKCQNEKDLLHVVLSRQHKFASKGDLFLRLVKNNVIKVNRVRKITLAEALCHVC